MESIADELRSIADELDEQAENQSDDVELPTEECQGFEIESVVYEHQDYFYVLKDTGGDLWFYYNSSLDDTERVGPYLYGSQENIQALIDALQAEVDSRE